MAKVQELVKEDFPGAGLKKKRKKVRAEVGQSVSAARHHGLRWDQIRFCVGEDLVGVDLYMARLWETSRLRRDLRER